MADTDLHTVLFNGFITYGTIKKSGVSKIFLKMFSYAYKGCIYLIKYRKTVILWNIII